MVLIQGFTLDNFYKILYHGMNVYHWIIEVKKEKFISPYLTEEYPIWHGQAPRIISTFLENYDFSGKTIVPFCTSHSSGIGSSTDNLHSLCAESVEWRDGKRFESGVSKESVQKWIEEIGIEWKVKK